MKTINKTQLLLKAIDIELKALLEQDLRAFRAAQVKQGNNQGAKKAA